MVNTEQQFGGFAVRTILKSLLVGAATLAIAGSASAANLIVNGGFNNGLTTPAPGGTFSTLGTGSTTINGWTVVGGGNIDWIRGFWQSADGDGYSVDLNGGAPGAIAQTITTIAGQAYNLTFFMSGNPDAFQSETRIAIIGAGGTTSGSTTYTLTGANSRANMLWSARQFTFLADSASTEIRFTSGNSGANCCYGGAIDNVAVNVVPEPATWAMMIIGFGAAGSVIRRRRAVAA